MVFLLILNYPDYNNVSYLQSVLHMIKEHNYLPDLITYGVLALGCSTKEEAIELLDEMIDRKYR